MLINFLVKPNHGPDWHRLLVPMESLPIEEGDNIQMGIYQVDEGPSLFKCDILVFNRTMYTTAEQLVRLRKKFKFKIVLDLDDYWNLNYDNPIYKHWNEDSTSQTIESYIKIADLVTVTNENLKAKVQLLNPNVEIIPNAIVFGNLPLRSIDKVKFLYAGSITHIPDLKLFEKQFRRIDPFIRDRASFVLAGVGDHNGWKEPIRIFNETKCAEFLSVLPLDEYMKHYDYGNVCLVPLKSGEFNSCKSILKVLEAGSRGLPCIVSKVSPYYPELKDAPIRWVERASDWLKHIRNMIKDPGSLETEGIQLYNWLRERYSLEDINKQRYNIYKKLLNE